MLETHTVNSVVLLADVDVGFCIFPGEWAFFKTMSMRGGLMELLLAFFCLLACSCVAELPTLL